VTLRRTLAAALGLLALAAAAGCGSAPAELEATPVDRVLVVSLPGLDWDGVKRAGLPHLDEFAGDAAVADLATRIGRRTATSTDAYLTLGAGTRAIAPRVDTAVAVDADETYGGVPASELVERRLGRVTPGIAYLAIGPAIDDNEHSPFGAEVGSLATGWPMRGCPGPSWPTPTRSRVSSATTRRPTAPMPGARPRCSWTPTASCPAARSAGAC
jgi:hypothetical protein